ncbi:MAG: asparagine synthase-related protein, partial [Candidatus Nanohaloarchaea archaeon]
MMPRPPVFVGCIGAGSVEPAPDLPPRATGDGAAMEQTDVGDATLFSTREPAVENGVAACFSGFLYDTERDEEAANRVVSLYLEKGLAFLDDVDGRFTTAIYDTDSNVLHLCADRKGCQTLYYGETDAGGVTFGTHLTPLLQLHGGAQVDREGVAAYLKSWPVFYSGDRSLVDKIARVPPAHRLRWQDGTTRTERYWNVRFGSYREVSDDTAADRLEALLRESIVERLPPDGSEPSLLLSGGLDSSLLAAMLTEVYDGDIHTFTAGFTEKQIQPGRDRAASLGTVHTETILPFRLPGKEDVWRWGAPFIGMLHMPLFRLFEEWELEQVFSGQTSPAAFPVGLGRLRMMDRFRPLHPLLRPLSRLPLPVHRLPDRALAAWEALAGPYRSSVI